MRPSFFELLAIFIVFYMMRLLFDSNYKTKDKKEIVIDVILTTILAFVLLQIFEFFN